MGHTSGPWRAVHNSILRDAVVGPEGDVVAEVLSPADPDQSSHANTDLIAESPNLLTALDDLMAQFIEVYRGDGWVTDRAYLRACEVLNRIGESGASSSPIVDWICITPAETFDLLTLASQVDDRSPSEQATLDRLARALEQRT